MASENYTNPDDCKFTPKRKVLGDIGNDSPVSPMANLKLLIKVATDQDDHSSLSDSVLSEEKHRAKRGFAAGYVRKNKSLGILCEKFLKMFPLDMSRGDSMVISLNNLARELGVEKRRVYDIINIMECLVMAEKVSKDTYRWFGDQNLAKTMGLFSEYAKRIGLHDILKRAEEGTLNRDGCRDLFDEQTISSFTIQTKCLLDNRRLGVLCQKFLMLLVVSHQKNSLVSLNAAVSLLVAGTKLAKTRHRRLYDIVNILQSLNIIRRILPNTTRPAPILKKPVFGYSGPKIENVSLSLSCKTENCTTIANHSDCIWNPIELDLDEGIPPKKEICLEMPAAKKRLLFTKQDSKPSNNIIHKSFDLFCSSEKRQLKPTKIEPGACYKAVKLGSSIHLVKFQ